MCELCVDYLIALRTDNVLLNLSILVTGKPEIKFFVCHLIVQLKYYNRFRSRDS